MKTEEISGGAMIASHGRDSTSFGKEREMVKAKMVVRAEPFALIAQDVLLSASVQFLRRSGLTRWAIASKLRSLAETLDAGNRVRTMHSAEYDLFVNVSGAVHDWTRSPDYTDVHGEPKPLALRGRHGLSALIRKRIPRSSLGHVLRWMRIRGIARRRKDGRYVLLQRAVLVGYPDPVYLEWAATIAAQHLTTAIENWEEKDPKCRHLDRIARVFNLPEREIPRFRDFAKKRAKSWLEEIDNWLEDHDAPRRRQRRVQAGVHVYGYVVGARTPSAIRAD